MITTQAGCYDWVAIQPAEIGKLQAGSQQVVGRSGNTTVMAISTQTVTAEDGTAAEIKGEYDLRLTTTSDQTATFAHPLLVKPNPPDGYIIQGGNRRATQIDLSTIKRVEVSQYSAGKTYALTMVAGLSLPLIVLGIFAASR